MARFIAALILTMALMETPSTRAATTWVRFDLATLFMCVILSGYRSIVKYKIQYIMNF
jgi:hypothetical protein